MNEPSARPTRKVLGLFEWPARMTSAERRTLIAGGLGWALDAMDVMLYSMILNELKQKLGMDDSHAGILNSVTLGASAVGGFLFGFVADRAGRARALLFSILIYSVASGACGFATSVAPLVVFRVLLGLGMGGEWTTGAALIAETWPARHRAKALGLMQSSWAIGEMLAAGVVAAIGFLPSLVPALRASDWWAGNSWRLVFFVGILPALLCFWIRRDVPEPEIWKSRRSGPEAAAAGGAAPRPPRRRWSELMTPEERRHAWLATAMNACAMFGYWGLFTWIPAYLKRPVAEGGRGLDLLATTTWLFVMFAGKFLGYSLFGFMADAFGRRRVYASYLFIAALLVPAFAYAPGAGWLLLLGPLVAFFGTGFFSGFSALASEIFPTPIRASALGLTYNVGRGIAAFAPFVVGAISDSFARSAPERGLATAFLFLAGMYLLAALLALRLPDSRGRELA